MILRRLERRRGLVLGLLMAVVGVGASDALGKEFFMAVDGSDGNVGTMEKPFGTITRAQAEAGPGDTVFIRGGKYNVTA